MQELSERYKKLLADPEHVREVKVNIAGVEYGQDKIYTCSTGGDLFPDVVAGSCISHEIDLTVDPTEEVPRMGTISLFSRLVRGEEASEWLPCGVFCIDTRCVDQKNGLLTLHGFDAMLKAEEVWWDPSEDAGEWPMPQEAAAVDIARRMGVSLDPRTTIHPAFRVEYPNDLTMREVLAYIAACHVGNWTMTGDGELLLLPLGGLLPETRLLVDGMGGGAILFGEVRILV